MIETTGLSRKKSSLFHDYLTGFRGPSGLSARVEETSGPHPVRDYTGEFWTSRQRQASSLHEISYRACFKPQWPGFLLTC